MIHELSGSIRARPLRVAFLVEEGEHWSLCLEGIFADCYSRWGGRFSLIVPCVNHQIPAIYWPWLETFDPDIVYSYVLLSEADINEVHERLGPSAYEQHTLGTKPRLDVYGFKPQYSRSAPLSSLSTLFKRTRYVRRHGGGIASHILDHYDGAPTSLFISDNFGTYKRANMGIFPLDAGDAGALLTIIPNELKGGRHGVPTDMPSVANDFIAFRAIIEDRAISMSLASIFYSPRLDIRHGSWSESFNLVVGDTYADRVMFWNARLFLPTWVDSDLCCLRVTLAQLRDPAFRDVLGGMLRHHNPVTGGRGGQPNVAIRSISHSAEDLEEARRLVTGTQIWGPVGATPIHSLDELVPNQEALRHARISNGVGEGLFTQPGWHDFKWSMPTAIPPVIIPPHLLDAPPRQSFTLGDWGNDVALDHDGPGARLGAGRPFELPRRWRMARSFKISMASSRSNVHMLEPRSNSHGQLTIFSNVDRSIEEIKVPTTFAAMQHALTVDGLQVGGHRGQRGYPPNKLDWMRPSDQGRYLSGVLGLTGGMLAASRFLLHPFLRKMFTRMGGTPVLPEGPLREAEQRVRKLARNVAIFDLDVENDRRVLAGMIVHAARSVSRPREVVSYDDLAEEWRADRQEFWEQHPVPNPDPDVDWDREEALSLDLCLQELRQRELIYQGFRWVCSRCHHRNWLDVSDLTSELSCAVCKHAKRLPVHFPWMFKPNEFLIESLRDHSVLSLIWALTALRERSRTSFMFVGPMSLGFGGHAGYRPQGEADLLVVSDGNAIFCEVKSSWRGLSSRELEQFVELAERLRPNIALMAVMEAGREMEEGLGAAQQRLAKVGITFELLNLDQFQMDFDPFLNISEEREWGGHNG